MYMKNTPITIQTWLEQEHWDTPRVSLYHITKQTWKKYITIEAAGSYDCLFVLHDADITLEIAVRGEGAHVRLWCLILSKDMRKTSLQLQVKLLVAWAVAHVYAVSLLGNNARVSLQGWIFLGNDAHGAEWYLQEENILLGEGIKIEALPMLDVQTNDVKASHGATMQRLDEQKLFYMNAKWISSEHATTMLIWSYIAKVAQHVSLDDDLLHHCMSDYGDIV